MNFLFYFTFFLFPYLFYFKNDFIYFEVTPHNSLLNSLVVISLQVSHPPGKCHCDFTIIDPSTNKNVFTSNVVDFYIYDTKIKNFLYDFEILIPKNTLFLNLYKINYHCQFKVTHHINKEYLFYNINSTYIIPDNYLPFNPNLNYVNDNTEKILNFHVKPFSDQKLDLDENLNYLINSRSEDSEFYLQQSILINDLLNVTNCTKNNLNNVTENECNEYIKYNHEKVLEQLEDFLHCDQIEEKIFKHNLPYKILSLSTTTFLYQTKNENIFKNSTFYKSNIILECLTKKGFNLLQKLKESLINNETLFKNVTEDYLNSISFAMSNSINILKNNLFQNVTTEKNDSLIINEFTLHTKSLIEENSLLLIKNNFIELKDNKIVTENLIFMNKNYKKSRELSENLINENYRNITIENNKTKINISFPIEYLVERFSLEEAKLGIILYDKYPLLSKNNQNYSENILSLKLFNENNEFQNVKNLTNPIQIIFRKPERSYNVCLYYDQYIKSWNDKNCKSIEIDDEFLLCEFTHFSEFTISNFNPIYYYDDIVNILNDTNWMTSFEEFKNLNFNNAIVIYIFSLIFILYCFILCFTLKFDLEPHRDSFFIDKTYFERPNLCSRIFNRKNLIEEIVDMKNLTEMSLISHKKKMMREYFSENIDNPELFKIWNKSNETNLILEDSNRNSITNYENDLRKTIMSSKVLSEDKSEIDYENLINKYHKKEIKKFRKNLFKKFNIKNKIVNSDNGINNNDLEVSFKNENETENSFSNFTNYSDNNGIILKLKNEFFLKTTALLKIIRRHNLYTALILDSDYKLNKTDILTLIFFNLTTSFAVCAIFSPCNSVTGKDDETSYGYKFYNRSFAVSILTLIIVNIPTKIFQLLLMKRIVYKGEENNKRMNRIFAYFIHFFVYIIFMVIFICCIVNTTWIYIRNYGIKRENVFVYYFVITLITKIVIKIIVFLMKSILFYFIIKNEKVPLWKVIMIVIGIILIYI